MKKTYHIKKSRLYGTVDYSSVLSDGRFNKYALQRVDLGEVEITTGTVCFFDPYNVRDAKPFTVAFPVGTYRPFVMTVSTDKGNRIALAGLDGGTLYSATEWRLALCDERDVIKLAQPDGTAGIVIGSGCGAICDGKATEDFSRLVKDNEGSFHPLDGAVNLDGSCACVCNLKNVRLPVFNTGWGEGCYNCYAGFDADGTVKGLLCDFDLIRPPRKRDDGKTVSFTFDVSVRDWYEADPEKNEAENNIARYSVILYGGSTDEEVVFDAYVHRGYAYHTLGKREEALSDYLQAIKLGQHLRDKTQFIKHAWALYDNAVRIYRETGRTRDIIALYEDAKSISDIYGGAYFGLIDMYCAEKDYAKALQTADEMVAARPQDPASYLRRSEVLQACEEYEKAVSDLDVLIDVFKLGESILDKAACLSYLGRHGEALTVLDTYLLQGRADEAYYNTRAEIHLADGMFAAAYEDARNAYAVNPDYLPTLEKLIEFDGLLLNYKNVIRWATRYLEIRPQSAYACNVRADAYAHTQEYEDALKDYYRLYGLCADTKYAALLVRTALMGSDKGTAKRYLKILGKADKVYYLYAMGLFLLHKKKYARAERLLSSAFAHKADDIILSALIDCYAACGAYEKANKALQTYKRISDGEEVFMKAAYIAEAQGKSKGEIQREYVDRFLHGCRDEKLLEKVEAFFA